MASPAIASTFASWPRAARSPCPQRGSVSSSPRDDAEHARTSQHNTAGQHCSSKTRSPRADEQGANKRDASSPDHRPGRGSTQWEEGQERDANLVESLFLLGHALSLEAEAFGVRFLALLVLVIPDGMHLLHQHMQPLLRCTCMRPHSRQHQRSVGAGTHVAQSTSRLA